jgi:type IV pilus assembly protein PilV
MRHLNPHSNQRGSFLLEALIAMLIFSLGILGLISLQGSGIAANTDLRYRVEAARMADRIMSQIQGGVARDATTGNITTNLSDFDHHPTGDNCTAAAGFTGSASARAEVVAWDTALRTTSGTALPNPNNRDWYQIRITPNGSTTGAADIRIAICWQQPGLDVPRRHILTGLIS